MFLSHVKYGVAVWHHNNETMRKKIQIVINKFMRIIFRKGYRDSVRSIMKDNCFLGLYQLFNKEMSLIQHKLECNLLPIHFKDLFEKFKINHSIVTRSRLTYNPSFCRSVYLQQNIPHVGPKIWNSIPEEVRFDIKEGHNELFDIKVFKKKFTNIV